MSLSTTLYRCKLSQNTLDGLAIAINVTGLVLVLNYIITIPFGKTHLQNVE